MTISSSPTIAGEVVIDASVAVAIVSKETDRDTKANAELARYSAQGYLWYAPGAIITETLYALCRKRNAGMLDAAQYAQAAIDFAALMSGILPMEEAPLVVRAQAIGEGFSCYRSADGLYVALAEELSKSRPTVLLTFDEAMPNQAKQNAPTVTVQLLTI
jgi:predicted nucleic acid-binding protein